MKEIKIFKSKGFIDELYNTNLQIDSGDNGDSRFVIIRLSNMHNNTSLEFGFDNKEEVEDIINILNDYKNVFGRDDEK